MKTFFIILLLISIAMRSYAQNDFAPIGAHWKVEDGGGGSGQGRYWEYISKKDTVINKQACRLIKSYMVDRTTLPGHQIDRYANNYVYNSATGDTVYYLLKSHFVPLFIFNVQRGDTVAYHRYNPNPSTNDTMFHVVVDSIKTIIYNSFPLKTVYVSSTDDQISGNAFGFGFGSVPFIEKLGSMGSGIFTGSPGIMEGPKNILCYYDGITNVKFDTIDCTDPPASINNVYNAATSIYPSFSNGQLSINVPPASETHIRILNVNGQVLGEQTLKNAGTANFDMSYYPAGIYLYQVSMDNKYVSGKVAVTQ